MFHCNLNDAAEGKWMIAWLVTASISITGVSTWSVDSNHPHEFLPLIRTPKKIKKYRSAHFADSVLKQFGREGIKIP
jgi:hypothetical protein